MSIAEFLPEINDQTLYHNGDVTVSTAQLLDAALAAAQGALTKTPQNVSVELDELRQTGFYHGYGVPQAPEAGFMYFLVIAYPDGYNYWTKQLAFSFADNKTYVRTMANGVWGAWDLLPLLDKVGTLGSLTTADKSTVVAAINELVANVKAAADAAGTAQKTAENAASTASAAASAASGAAPAYHVHSQYLTAVPNYSSNSGDTIYVVGPDRNAKTVQALVDTLPKVSAGARQINIDAGDYPERVLLKGFHGGQIRITSGDASNRARLLGVLLEDCTATIVVDGVDIVPVSGQNPTHGVYPTRCKTVKVENCNITSVAYGMYFVQTDKLVVRNTTVNAIGGNLTAGVALNTSEGTIVALDGLTVNGGYGSTAIVAQNALIVGKRPAMNSVDIELNSNAGGVLYSVV